MHQFTVLLAECRVRWIYAQRASIYNGVHFSRIVSHRRLPLNPTLTCKRLKNHLWSALKTCLQIVLPTTSSVETLTRKLTQSKILTLKSIGGEEGKWFNSSARDCRSDANAQLHPGNSFEKSYLQGFFQHLQCART